MNEIYKDSIDEQKEPPWALGLLVYYLEFKAQSSDNDHIIFMEIYTWHLYKNL